MSQLIKKIKDKYRSLKKLIKVQKARIVYLETENTKLRNMISITPGNLFWKNKEGKFLGCNNNLAKLFGYVSADEIIGKTNADIMDTLLAENAELTDKETFSSKKELCFEEVGFNDKNEMTVYLTKKIPLFNNEGEPTELLGISFDITERKNIENALQVAKEKAEASDYAKSQFLAVITHELRTPLSSVIGLIELLKGGATQSEEEKNILLDIENCAQHLLSLVNDVLDFSSLEKQKYSLHMISVNLSETFREVCRLLSLCAKKKGLELGVDLDPKLNKPILTDPRILKQILINLISNAIKFTEQGKISIQVSVLSQNKEKVNLKISVIDTGKGIPQDKLEVIFEPFQQLEDAYTRQSSRHGTGLGLTIVQKLTELIGAEIQVSSSLGQGSEFSLYGEFKIQEWSPLLLGDLSQSDSMEDSKKRHVLLVEDDPIIQYIHKQMLEKLNCIVAVEAFGLNAIKLAPDYDIIFMDLSLPDISGFEAIKTIREQNPDNNMPIIGLTVYTGKAEKEACIKAGANEFASKPVSQVYLKKILMQYENRE